MSRKKSTPKSRHKFSRRRRRDPFLLGDFRPELADEPAHSRLYVDDDEYIKQKQATGVSQSELIREYVHKAVEAERLRRAARDPYVAKLVELLNTTVSRHTEKLERRLSMEFHTLRRLTASTIVLGNAALRVLEAYVASQPPPDEAAIAERRKAYFTGLYRKFISEAEGILGGMLDERDEALALLAEKELITGLQDHELEATLEELKAVAGGEAAAP